MASTDKSKSRVMNLDTLERERPADGKERVPFVIVIGGREITMKDPNELGIMELLDIEEPVHFLRYCLSDDDRKVFKAANIPGWKFRELMTEFQRHYGLDTPGNGVASRI